MSRHDAVTRQRFGGPAHFRNVPRNEHQPHEHRRRFVSESLSAFWRQSAIGLSLSRRAEINTLSFSSRSYRFGGLGTYLLAIRPNEGFSAAVENKATLRNAVRHQAQFCRQLHLRTPDCEALGGRIVGLKDGLCLELVVLPRAARHICKLRRQRVGLCSKQRRQLREH